MAADLKRCQELAEPLGWGIAEINDPTDRPYNLCLTTAKSPSFYNSLAPIRERLAKEYRELAKQEEHTTDVLNRLDDTNTYTYTGSYWVKRLTRIADELSVVEEPTMVERLRKFREQIQGVDADEAIIIDALIHFGERLDALERGKE